MKITPDRSISYTTGDIMRRIVVSMLVVCCAFAVPVAIDAQTKKTEKTTPAPAVKGKVEIVQNKLGFRFRVVNAEDKTIAMPPPAKHWEKKEEVLAAIDELKGILATKPVDVNEKDK
jgi:hypothetical protein